MRHIGQAVMVLPLIACAEVQVGVELAKRANRAIDANLAVSEPQVPQSQQTASVSPYLKPAPEVFEASGIAQWDGKRTLQGVWVAHPLATTARRVRIFNSETGQAVDGALFKRDSALTGASVLVSSEAAQRLGIQPGGSAELRIVAVTPVPQSEQTAPPPSAADVAEDQTDKPVVSQVAPEKTAEKSTAGAIARVVTPTPRPVDPKTRDIEQPVAEKPAVVDKPAKPEEPTVVAKAEPAQREPAKVEPAKAEPTKVETAKAKPAAKTEKPAANPRVEAAEVAPSDTDGAFKWDSAAADTTEQSDAKKKAEPSKPKVQAVAKAEPAAKTKKPAASKLRQPFLQAGVFGVKANANRLISRLKKRGIPAVGKPVRASGRQMTRVLAGPFASVAQRNNARAALRKLGLRDAVPVRR